MRTPAQLPLPLYYWRSLISVSYAHTAANPSADIQVCSCCLLWKVLNKLGDIQIGVLVRRLRSVELQVCRYRVVDRFHFHGYCRLLCVCHLSLLNGSHDCILRHSVGKSELIEVCLVLSDAESESLVALCILCVQVGEVDLLTLQLGVLSHMKSKL